MPHPLARSSHHQPANAIGSSAECPPTSSSWVLGEEGIPTDDNNGSESDIRHAGRQPTYSRHPKTAGHHSSSAFKIASSAHIAGKTRRITSPGNDSESDSGTSQLQKMDIDASSGSSSEDMMSDVSTGRGRGDRNSSSRVTARDNRMFASPAQPSSGNGYRGANRGRKTLVAIPKTGPLLSGKVTSLKRKTPSTSPREESEDDIPPVPVRALDLSRVKVEKETPQSEGKYRRLKKPAAGSSAKTPIQIFTDEEVEEESSDDTKAPAPQVDFKRPAINERRRATWR